MSERRSYKSQAFGPGYKELELTVTVVTTLRGLAELSALVITSITFDKPVYKTGDTITAVVAYTGSGFTLAAVATALGQTGMLNGTFTVLPDWTPSDSGNRPWFAVSDNGIAAVFTAVA